MREPARDKERLIHIKEAIDRIARYINGVTMEELMADDMRYYIFNFLYNFATTNKYL